MPRGRAARPARRLLAFPFVLLLAVPREPVHVPGRVLVVLRSPSLDACAPRESEQAGRDGRRDPTRDVPVPVPVRGGAVDSGDFSSASRARRARVETADTNR